MVPLPYSGGRRASASKKISTKPIPVERGRLGLHFSTSLIIIGPKTKRPGEFKLKCWPKKFASLAAQKKLPRIGAPCAVEIDMARQPKVRSGSTCSPFFEIRFRCNATGHQSGHPPIRTLKTRLNRFSSLSVNRFSSLQACCD